MEKYKKTLKTRIAILGFGIAGLIALIVLTQSGIITTTSSAAFSDFLSGFQMGMMTGVIGIFVIIMVKYVKFLGNDEKLKAEYFCENDERKNLIMLKIGGTPMYVCSIVILLAGIVAGYFDKTVFFSLIGCAMFLLIARGILKVYYNKKF